MKAKIIKYAKKLLIIELTVFIILTGALVFSYKQFEAYTKEKEKIATADLKFVITPIGDGESRSRATVKTLSKKVADNNKIKILIGKARALEYIPAESASGVENTATYKAVVQAYSWNGAKISHSAGSVTGPNGRETYYNLNMGSIVNMMHARGNKDPYWVRNDGCKMLGNYIMVAANLNVHPRGSIVKSSRGLAIVCDTGGFASSNPNQLDIATNW